MYQVPPGRKLQCKKNINLHKLKLKGARLSGCQIRISKKKYHYVMAWGYWTTYSATAQTLHSRHHRGPQSPPFKREHSLEREARAEKERLLKSNSSGSIHEADTGGGGGGIVRGSQQVNHIAPEKVAYERHLLLGDPDWSNRTIADRNTLPRKKAFDQYERGSISPPEEVYYSTQKSPITPPGSGASRKSSDDVFCPACAHQSASQHTSSNRESRVSFGSVASSSRGSSGIHAGHLGPSRGPPRRSISVRVNRSRSQEDDESSGHGGMASSSVPTPPPPPFLSQRDLVHSSLLETINQKMSILSSIRSAMPSTANYPLPSSTSYHHTPLPPRPQTAPRRFSAGKHLTSKHHQTPAHATDKLGGNGGNILKTNGRKSSSTSLKEPSQSSLPSSGAVMLVHGQPRSSRSSSRTTPRGSSSHASHESIKSSGGGTTTSHEGGSGKPLPAAKMDENKIEVLEVTREDGSYDKMGLQVDEDISKKESGGSVIGIRRGSVSDKSRSRSRTPDIDDDNETADDEREAHQTGTVRRKRRKSHSKSSQEKLELLRNSQERLEIGGGAGANRQPCHSQQCLDCATISRHPELHHHTRPYSRSQENLEDDSADEFRTQNRTSVQFTIGDSVYMGRRHHPSMSHSQEELEHQKQVIVHHNYHKQHSHPGHLSYSQEKLDSSTNPFSRHNNRLKQQGGQRSDESFLNSGKALPPPPPLPPRPIPHDTNNAGNYSAEQDQVHKLSLQQQSASSHRPIQQHHGGQQAYHHHHHPQTLIRPRSFHDNVDPEHLIRPRSASIGDRLSETNEPEPSPPSDRRHHTLDGHRRGILASTDRRLASMTSFQSTLPSSSMSATSSRSEKSSSRSSKSPSMENIKSGRL